MRDAELLAKAIEAAGMSQRGFARHVLGFDTERQVQRWLAGTSPTLHPSVRVICTAVLADPSVAELLRAAWADREAIADPRRKQGR